MPILTIPIVLRTSKWLQYYDVSSNFSKKMFRKYPNIGLFRNMNSYRGCSKCGSHKITINLGRYITR
jgi:hypothetical protein